MRICKAIAVFVLAAAPCLAIDITACGDAIATRGATYVLKADLVQSGATPCLTVTAANPANVVIDGNGHSITFDGVAISLGNRDGIEIHDHTFIAAASGHSASAFTWLAIDGSNDSASNILVHHNVFTMNHDAAPEPYGFFVSNATSDNVEIHHNACNIGGAYHSTCFEVTGSGAKTNWRIHHNTILATGTSNNRPTGIGLIGTTGADVSYNTIQVNDPGTIGDIDQMQSISCYACITPNLHHNTITEYGTHGRVFSVDNVQGGSIHHNPINLSGDGSGGNLQGIGMRGDTIGVEVYQNVIDARGCAAPGGCGPLWIGNDTNPGDGTFPGGNRIHDNWLYVAGPATMVGLAFTEDWDPDNRFWNNTISCEGSSHCLEFNPLSHEQLDGEVAFTAFLDTSDALTIRAELASAIHDIDFCESTVNGSPLSIGDVDDHNSTLPDGEPGFTSSPCLCEVAGLGCGPEVGARSDAAAEPATTITGAGAFLGSFSIW
jgi:hypothetical protein